MSADDRYLEAIASNNHGQVCLISGEYKQAIKFFERALMLSEEVGDSHLQVVALGSLGTSYRKSAQDQLALTCFHQGAILAHAIGDLELEASSLGNLGLTYATLRKFPEATDCFKRARTMFEADGNKAAISQTNRYLLVVRVGQQIWRAIYAIDRLISRIRFHR